MHFLLHVGKMIGSFQYPNVVSFFFLKRFLSFLHFQWPSRLSLPSVYLIFPSSLTTTSRRGFPSKKIPQRKKFNPAPGKKRICYRRSHRQSANQRSRQGSIQQERDTALPKESLALLPPGRCFWQGSQLPPLKGQSFSRRSIWTYGSLSNHLRNSPANVSCEDVYLQRRYDFRRWSV